jgi:hypothetical protein
MLVRIEKEGMPYLWHFATHSFTDIAVVAALFTVVVQGGSHLDFTRTTVPDSEPLLIVTSGKCWPWSIVWPACLVYRGSS